MPGASARAETSPGGMSVQLKLLLPGSRPSDLCRR